MNLLWFPVHVIIKCPCVYRRPVVGTHTCTCTVAPRIVGVTAVGAISMVRDSNLYQLYRTINGRSQSQNFGGAALVCNLLATGLGTRNVRWKYVW